MPHFTITDPQKNEGKIGSYVNKEEYYELFYGIDIFSDDEPYVAIQIDPDIDLKYPELGAQPDFQDYFIIGTEDTPFKNQAQALQWATSLLDIVHDICLTEVIQIARQRGMR